MLNLNEDHANLRALLANIGYDGSHTEDEEILKAIVAVTITLDNIKLSSEARKVVTDLVSREGAEAVRSIPSFAEDAWVEFDYGNVVVGDYVRVKPDAYDSPSGERHNGLVGVLTSLRGHKADVRYIGLASGNTMKHPKEKLLSLRYGVY